MAIPTTDSVPLLFSSQEPAWERGVDLMQMMTTSVITSRAGLEQRQQLRHRGQFQISFMIYHDADSSDARWARNLAETQGGVVVPFWTEEAILATMVGNTITISRRSTPDWFTPGDYVLLTDGTQSQFRQISSVGATDQELNLVAMTGGIDFADLSRVIPCRICIREQGASEIGFPGEASGEERVSFVTL